MRSQRRSLTLTMLAAAVVLNLVGFLEPAAGTTIEAESFGGNFIQRELFRGVFLPFDYSQTSDSWAPFSFTFSIPIAAATDGVLNIFAGGDLNRLDTDTIEVLTDHFSVSLGTLAFPVLDINGNPINCGGTPHSNRFPCPIPETVPGGMFNSTPLIPQDDVGAVQGHRGASLSNAGTAGLIIPKDLINGAVGQTLGISLFPNSEVFDLYIDRLELSYTAVPEPSTLLLFASGLGVLWWRASRRTSIR